MEEARVRELLVRQRAYFATGATRGWEARKQALRRLEQVLVAHRDEVLEALAKDLGKPDVEAYLAEYYFLLQELRLIRKKLKKWLKTRRVGTPPYFQPCRSAVRRDPYGSVLILAPWNYPLQLALSPLFAAVAAGNTVVLKPSELTPACEALLVNILAEAFGEEHVAVVTGGVEVASGLLDEKFDRVFFTGSTRVGRIVAEKSAVHLTPAVLELGGKCPCVVDATVNVKSAARKILAGKFFNGGQTCFAPDFVVADVKVKDALVEEMKKVLGEVPWGEEMARVIHRGHFDRLRGMIPEGALKFGEDDEEGLRLAPRLIVDAGWDDAVMEEEIFGPLLPVIGYEDTEGLLDRLKGESPLALYLFSDDKAWRKQMVEAIPSGGVCVNDTMKQGSNLNLPFGGVGESGYGRYRGRAGVEAFSYARAEVVRPSWARDFLELMPPYGGKIKWLKKFLR